MGAFIDLLQQEIVTTIEALTGSVPQIAHESLDDTAALMAPFALLDIHVEGDLSGTIRMSITPPIATRIADIMQGGEGKAKAQISAEDLGTMQKMIETLFSSFSATLTSQKNMSKLIFTPKTIQTIEAIHEEDFEAFDKLFIYTILLDTTQGIVSLAFTSGLLSLIADEKGISLKNVQANAGTAKKSAPFAHHDELGNIDLIKDVKLPVRVRIGSKKMLLKDVLSMDIGSVIELDQLANDPLEILVGDKVIATGDVVIVDGNFGIQIGEIGTRRERLEKLR